MNVTAFTITTPQKYTLAEYKVVFKQPQNRFGHVKSLKIVFNGRLKAKTSFRSVKVVVEMVNIAIVNTSVRVYTQTATPSRPSTALLSPSSSLFVYGSLTCVCVTCNRPKILPLLYLHHPIPHPSFLHLHQSCSPSLPAILLPL